MTIRLFIFTMIFTFTYCVGGAALAQTVTYATLSATVTDTGSTPYALGSVIIHFVPPAGQQCGIGNPPNTSFQRTYTVPLDSTGSFSAIVIPTNSSFNCANSQWAFTTSSQGGYGVATVNLTISGSGSISSSLSNQVRISWSSGMQPPPGGNGQVITSLGSAMNAWETVATSLPLLQWINAMTISGAKRDGHYVTYSTSGGGTVTAILTGNCSASDVGKNFYSINNNGGGSGTSAPFVQIASCTPGTSFTVSGGTLVGSQTNGGGWIGTDDLAAINSCLAAAYALGSVCYLPGGGLNNPYWVSANITDPGSTGAYVFAGDSIASTRIVFPPANTTGLFLEPSNYNAVYRDFELDSGTSGAGTPWVGSSCTEPLVLMNARGYRVGARNWQCTGNGGQACFDFSADGIQSSQMETSGCDDGFEIAATGMTLDRPICSAQRSCIHNIDVSTNVVGGELAGAQQDVLSDIQNGNGTIYLEGVTLEPSSGAAAINTVANSKTWVAGGIVAGLKSCPATGNATGIIVVSGATLYVRDTQMCSLGTGTTIENAGTFVNGGGVIFPSIGSGGIYTGAGVGIGQGGGESGTIGCTTSAATITFNNVYGVIPVVTIQDRTTSGVVTQTSISVTQEVVGCPGASDNLNYQVSPNPI